MYETFYVTFGFGHQDLAWWANHNGWITIKAPNWDMAREKAFELTGGRFSFMYTEEGFDPSYFPSGEQAVFTCDDDDDAVNANEPEVM